MYLASMTLVIHGALYNRQYLNHKLFSIRLLYNLYI